MWIVFTYQYLGSGGRRCCSTAPYGQSSECRINFLSSLSRRHCLFCWITSAWWRPLARPTGWLIRTLLCALARFSSPQPRRPGGLEEEREEEQRDWARVRRLRVPWILSGTSRHCTTCCSCGQVRTMFQRRIHPPSGKSVALKSTIDCVCMCVCLISANTTSPNRWPRVHSSELSLPGAPTSHCPEVGSAPQPGRREGGVPSRSRRTDQAGKPPANQSVRWRLEHLWTRPSVGTGSGLWRGGRKWEWHR